MVILIPFRLAIFVWLFLSAMLLVGYIGFSLREGRTSFAPYSLRDSMWISVPKVRRF